MQDFEITMTGGLRGSAAKGYARGGEHWPRGRFALAQIPSSLGPIRTGAHADLVDAGL